MAIRAARDAAGLSLRDLAESTEMSLASLSRSENGLRDLAFGEAISIASCTRLNIDALKALAEALEREGAPRIQQDRMKANQELAELKRIYISVIIDAQTIVRR